MSNLVVGLFTDSAMAGEAIGELKEKGYTKDISVVAKDMGDPELKSHDIKKDVSDGAGAGAVTGAAVGAAAGIAATLLAGAISVVVPGVGLVVAGPLAAGLAGAATGAVTGGAVGALVDLGFPEEKAKMYEHHIQSGDTLVAISTSEDKSSIAEQVLADHGAVEIQVLNERE